MRTPVPPKKVLDLHNQGKTQKEISEELGISQGEVSKILSGRNYRKNTRNIPQKGGNIPPKNGNIPQDLSSPAHLGYDNHNNQMPPSSSSSIPNQPDSQLRLHRIYRLYELDTSSQQPSLAIPIKLNNTEQERFTFEGTGWLRTTKNLILDGLELYSDLDIDAPQLKRYAELLADGLAMQIEQQRGIVLKRTATKAFIVETKMTEEAITREGIATKITENRSGIVPLYWNQKTGKVELWGDKSKHFAELEGNNPDTLKIMQDFHKEYVLGVWRIEGQLELNQKQLALNQQTIEFQKQEQQFFQKHNLLIDNVNHLIDEFRSESEARRATSEPQPSLWKRLMWWK